MIGQDDAPPPERGLKSNDFKRLGTFITAYSGIKMPPSKKVLLEGRLRRRLRTLDLPDFDTYCDYLFDQGGIEDEAVHLVDAITTNKTEFFREPAHFAFLAERVLPHLSARGIRTIRAWSAACSVGAEPYSMAMVMEKFACQTPGLDYSILATDLCTEVLAVAQDGIYPEDMVAPIPMDLRRSYLLRSRHSDCREVRIAPELRRRVQFAQLNLMNGEYGLASPFHVIFCRNVLIYFERETQAKVMTRLARNLAPGGVLFLGHSETLTGLNIPLNQIAPTTFVKPEGGP